MLLAWLLSLSVIGVTVVIHSAGLGALMRRLSTMALAAEGLRHSLINHHGRHGGRYRGIARL